MHASNRTWVTALVLGAIVLVASACETLGDVDPDLDEAIREALPALEEYTLVRLDDGPLLERLEGAALQGDGSTPLRFPLPVVDADGTLTPEFVWTAYPHDVRTLNQEFGGVPVFGVHDPSLELGQPLVDVLTGPSLTFQGVPVMTTDDYRGLLESAWSGAQEYDEEIYQPSVLNVLSGASFGQELEGAYYGPRLEAPSVLQGLRSLLTPVHGSARVESLLQGVEENYLVYNHVHYQPGLEHVDEDHAPAVPAAQHEDHEQEGHEQHEASEPRATTLAPQDHAFTDGWRTVNLVPVADDTVYDPEDGTWAIDDWFSRMEAAVNRMSLFNVFVNVHPDHAGSADADNNRFLVRARIPEYRVLTQTGKDRLVPHPSSGCGGSGSYRDEIRQLSLTTERYANEYWLWSTQDDFSGGGCSYTQVIDLAPNAGANCDQIDNRSYANCGSLGYIELRSGHTQDWTSLVVIHEAGHALNGRHDNDAFGSTGEADNSQRCTFLGIWEFGPTGPSIMSYASGTNTYCFAWTPPDGSPVRNVSLVADFLHEVLDPD